MRVVFVGILMLATVLRFWQLGAKPLWFDELYTAFESLGHNPTQIPWERLLPLSSYYTLLEPSPQVTLWDVAQTVVKFDNHPPLFFLLMHLWVEAWGTSREVLRSQAAISGVGLVWVIAQVGNQLGGKSVGVMAALLMAVSPFAVYLSQEARHYTLPMLVATLALVPWLKLIQAIPQQAVLPRKPLWLWVFFNTLAFYLHYFCLFGVIVQWGILLIALGRWRSPLRTGLWIMVAIATTAFLCLGMLPIILQQLANGGANQTQWLSSDPSGWQAVLMPLIRTLAAAIMMVVLLPVEQVPIQIGILAGAMMLGIWSWGLRQVFQGWRHHLSQGPEIAQIKFLALAAYAGGILAVILGIVYGLHKDLTLAPRYFFTLYPALTVLLAVGWANLPGSKTALPAWSPKVMVWIVAGLISIVMMGLNLTLFKPFLPDQVAEPIAKSQPPIVVLMVAPQPLERFLGLSYVLALPPKLPLWWEFIQGLPQDGDLRGSKTTLPMSLPASQSQFSLSSAQSDQQIPKSNLTLWLLELHRSQPFPQQVQLADHHCSSQGDAIVITGTHQQAYQCQRIQP